MKFDKRIPTMISKARSRYQRMNLNTSAPVDTVVLLVMCGELVEICEMQQEQINQLKERLKLTSEQV